MFQIDSKGRLDLRRDKVSKSTAFGEIERKKVLFLLPSLGGGGAEQVTVTLMSHLDRLSFDPHLGLLEKVGPFLQDVPKEVPIYDLKATRVRYALPTLLRLVWSLRPQTVLSALAELNLAMGLIKPLMPRGTRLIVRVDISVSEDMAQTTRHSGLWRWLYRHFYSSADKIICVSDFVRNDLAEHFGIPLKKMVLIYNPVDVQRVRQLADVGESPYLGGGPHLLAIGRLSWQKGFDVLLDALALVRKKILAQLTILGEGPLETDLKAQKERLGLMESVRFVGFQTNPYPYFKHADLFVLSSRYEGLGNVILEAMALGVPVVATDCPGGVREILAGWGMGLLVPNLNPQALADGIISALSDRAPSASRTGNLEGVPDKFKIERVMKQYEDLF